jgi:hypothetical protein
VSLAIDVNFDASADEQLIVKLDDGRTISAPVRWFSRLRYASSKARNTWQLVGGGMGIHWPLLDEDISVKNLLAMVTPAGAETRSDQIESSADAATETRSSADTPSSDAAVILKMLDEARQTVLAGGKSGVFILHDFLSDDGSAKCSYYGPWRPTDRLKLVGALVGAQFEMSSKKEKP